MPTPSANEPYAAFQLHTCPGCLTLTPRADFDVEKDRCISWCLELREKKLVETVDGDEHLDPYKRHDVEISPSMRATVVERWPGIFKLLEEMNELGLELGKLMAFPEGHHPGYMGQTPLIQRVADELADVTAALRYFQSVNEAVLPNDRIKARVEHKIEKFRRWGLSGVKSVELTPRSKKKPKAR